MLKMIKVERARFDMNMQDLANAIGVTPQTIYNWENGRTDPKPNHIVALARVFGCSTDYILGLTEQRRWR